MVTKVRLSLEEFLALPEEPPYLELIDGEAVPKPMPNALHAALAVRLGTLFTLFRMAAGRNTFHVATELRHIDTAHQWVFLPDLSILLKSNSVANIRDLPDPVPYPPDLAIEIMSPGDSGPALVRRVSSYFRAGTALVWLVDPADRTVTVCLHDEQTFLADPARPLSAAPVLPDFQLDIPALFAILDE